MHLDGARFYVAIALQDKVTVVGLNTLTVTGEIAGMSMPDGWRGRKIRRGRAAFDEPGREAKPRPRSS